MGIFTALSLPIFVFLIAANAATISNECQSILKDQGISSDNFAIHVYHAIHTVTLDDLKMFEPTVTENNRVPTLTRDNYPNRRVLKQTPNIRTKNHDRFKTDAMKMLDLVLSDLSDRQYFQPGYSVLEELVHNVHMHEFLANMLGEYQKLKSNPTKISSNVCKCVLDVDNNGIMEVLNSAAHNNVSAIAPACEDTVRYQKLDGHVNYCSTRSKRGIIGPQFCLKRGGNEQIGNCGPPTEEQLHFVGEKAWSLYVNRLSCLEGNIFEPTLFLYCALNQSL